MPDPKEEQRQAAAREAGEPGPGVKPIEQAMSSKRLKPKDKLDKNKGSKPPGDSRSGSDSNASRATRGY